MERIWKYFPVLLVFILWAKASPCAQNYQGDSFTFSPPKTFGSLGGVVNGRQQYCKDCNPTSNPCTAGGTGAMAQGINNQWVCTPGTGGSVTPPPFITLNPMQYGCHNDINWDTSVGAANNTATITSTNNPWTAADVGKSIELVDTTATYSPFVGTITAYNAPSSVTMNAVPTGVTNGDAFSAYWGTSDDTCLSNLTAAMTANTTALNGVDVHFNVPIIFTQSIVFSHITGRVSGNGCGLYKPRGPTTGSPFIYMGATPDVNGITVKASWNLTLDNLCVIGNSYAPLKSGLDYQQLISPPDTINVMNMVENSYFGYGWLMPNMPYDAGQVYTATPTAISGNTITLASTVPFASPGPGPEQQLEVVDVAGGAPEGNELVQTAQTYVRGANPILLQNNLIRTHTPATTRVLITQPAVITGVLWDNKSSQDDKNKVLNVQTRGVNTCINVNEAAAQGAFFHGLGCTHSLVGISLTGGNMIADVPEMEGVGVWLTDGNVGDLMVNEMNGQQGGGGGTYGPGLRFNIQGGYIPILTQDSGPTDFGTITCNNCFIDLCTTLNVNGDIINLGKGQADDVRFIRARLGIDANCPLANTTNPTIHAYGGSGSHDTVFEGRFIGNVQHQLSITDPGGADNRAFRSYHLSRLPANSSDSPDIVDLILRGTESYNGVPSNKQDKPGLLSQYGNIFAKQIDAPPASILSVTCTGGTGGPTDYWYHYAWSVGNGKGTQRYQNANLTGFSVNCTNPPSAVNPISVTVWPVRGGQQLNLFQASCAHGCADPLNETQVASQPNNTTPSSGFGQNTIQDTGGGPGIAMPPTVNGNTTGLITADFGFGLTKLGADPIIAPGNANCWLYALQGTTGGTCKIQAICGTSSTPVTIMDNIGGGC